MKFYSYALRASILSSGLVLSSSHFCLAMTLRPVTHFRLHERVQDGKGSVGSMFQRNSLSAGTVILPVTQDLHSGFDGIIRVDQQASHQVQFFGTGITELTQGEPVSMKLVAQGQMVFDGSKVKTSIGLDDSGQTQQLAILQCQPQGRIVRFFENGEGPTAWHFVYQPAHATNVHDQEGIPPEQFLNGKTPYYVAFRTGYAKNREDAADPYMVPYTQKALRNLRKTPGLEKLQVLWVDEGNKRPPSKEGFDFFELEYIPGNLRDPEQIRALIIPIVEYVKSKGGVIVGAGSQYSNRLLFHPVLQEYVRDSGMNPYIPVNALQSVFDTKIKSIFREKIAKHAPQRAVPFSVQEFPQEFNTVVDRAKIDGITHEQDAAATEKRKNWWETVGAPIMSPAVQRMLVDFEKMTAENPGRQFVMKPNEAAGKMGFQGDISNVDDAKARYLAIFEEFLRFYLSPKRSGSSLPQEFKVQTELKLRSKAGEYDVEFVMRRMPGGLLEVKALPIGNPTPVPVTMTEGGMTFPAMLSRELTLELIHSALESAVAASYPFLPFFNRHDEQMLDDGKVFLPIESNWPRSGGGLLTFPVVSRFLGAYLEDGMRSAMGLPLTPLKKQQNRTAVVRKILSSVTGFVRKIEIEPSLHTLPWLHIEAPLIHPEGDPANWPRVISAEHAENAQGSNGIGVVAWSDPHQPQEQALARARQALGQILLKIRTVRDDPDSEGIYPANYYHSNGFGFEKRFPIQSLLHQSVESVLAVCTGNMFRSPLTAFLIEQGLRRSGVEDVLVFSRGVAVDRSTHLRPMERHVHQMYGLDLQTRLPTQISVSDIVKASLILVMTQEHKDKLARLVPKAGSKIYLLNEFAGLGKHDLVDPLVPDLENLSHAADLISDAVQGVLHRLINLYDIKGK